MIHATVGSWARGLVGSWARGSAVLGMALVLGATMHQASAPKRGGISRGWPRAVSSFGRRPFCTSPSSAQGIQLSFFLVSSGRCADSVPCSSGHRFLECPPQRYGKGTPYLELPSASALLRPA